MTVVDVDESLASELGPAPPISYSSHARRCPTSGTHAQPPRAASRCAGSERPAVLVIDDDGTGSTRTGTGPGWDFGTCASAWSRSAAPIVDGTRAKEQPSWSRSRSSRRDRPGTSRSVGTFRPSDTRRRQGDTPDMFARYFVELPVAAEQVERLLTRRPRRGCRASQARQTRAASACSRMSASATQLQASRGRSRSSSAAAPTSRRRSFRSAGPPESAGTAPRAGRRPRGGGADAGSPSCRSALGTSPPLGGVGARSTGRCCTVWRRPLSRTSSTGSAKRSRVAIDALGRDRPLGCVHGLSHLCA